MHVLMAVNIVQQPVSHHRKRKLVWLEVKLAFQMSNGKTTKVVGISEAHKKQICHYCQHHRHHHHPVHRRLHHQLHDCLTISRQMFRCDDDVVSNPQSSFGMADRHVGVIHADLKNGNYLYLTRARRRTRCDFQIFFISTHPQHWYLYGHLPP